MNNKPQGRDEDRAFEDALSPVVNRLIDKNYETSKDKIASQMAPLIGSAIREQIKSQKDDVVDALYPVMGNMISKYVTQSLEDLLEKINTQIQNGLSVEALKRKIKAKIKGVSETELMLSEMSSSDIQAVLLIHKESGVVLSHIENEKINEPEMLASMMTAIRSFVNDWVDQNSTNHELGEIEYGGNKIIIEASGYSYLAVIVKGGSYKKTYDAIARCLENIVLKYGDAIRNFNGDITVFDQEALRKEMLPLLELQNNDEQEAPKKMHPLIYIIPLLLLIWGVYGYYKHYTQEQIEQQAATLLYKTPQLTTYRLLAKVEDGKLLLKGEVPSKYHKELAQKVLSGLQKKIAIKNDIITLNKWQDPLQINTAIAYTLLALNTQEGINLKYDYDYTTVTLQGKVSSKKQKEQVLELIKGIKGIETIKDEIQITPPKLTTNIYFKSGETQLGQEAQNKITDFAKKVKDLDENQTIFVTIFSDMKGSQTTNKHLSHQRALAIEKFLKEVLKIKNPLSIEEKLAPPPDVNIEKEAQKARRATLSLTKASR